MQRLARKAHLVASWCVAKLGMISWRSYTRWRGRSSSTNLAMVRSPTTLQEVLTKRGIKTLILTGVTTEVCVSSTLRTAVDLGYRCITVSDACASGDPALHKASLAMIGVEGGVFGEVATTAEVVERFAR